MTGETGPIAENPCLLAVEKGKVGVSARPLEALGESQVRVKVEYSMVSPGTELHHILGTHTKPFTYPGATGYISVGRIVGMGTKAAGFKLGERVLLQQNHRAFHNADTARAKAVPEGVDPVDACATILLGISLRGVRGGKIRIGDSVAVVGLGVIGLYAVHLAKVAGAYPVIGADPVAVRRDAAKRLGADVVLDPLACDTKAEVHRLTHGEGARVSIDASGTPKVIATLPDLTAAYGRVVVLGGVHGSVPFDLYTRFQKSNLTMVGCGSAYPEDYPFDGERNEFALLQMIAAGMVRPRPAITHVVPWREGPEIYRMLIEEKDKIIGAAFDWSR
ncbi:MAG: zinc-binding alcohol dehydrogenase [Planctomycetes bacterium]|nr:zinc-binding alcohol dehydrogenase [Planctomycetota bacterium]